MRLTHYVSRLADELNTRLNPEGHTKSTSLFVVDTGKQTTFTGTGKCLEEFQEKTALKSYSGADTEIAKFYDMNFDTAPLKFIKFDQAFHKVVPYDCRESKCYKIVKSLLFY